MSTAPTRKRLDDAYAIARERYAGLGVDAEGALAALGQVALSLHCWQGDDVAGFENPDAELSGGIAATGNYPGKARTADELRSDLDLAYGLIPGRHRLNLHAIYAETGGQQHPRRIVSTTDGGRDHRADDEAVDAEDDAEEPISREAGDQASGYQNDPRQRLI